MSSYLMSLLSVSFLSLTVSRIFSSSHCSSSSNGGGPNDQSHKSELAEDGSLSSSHSDSNSSLMTSNQDNEDCDQDDVRNSDDYSEKKCAPEVTLDHWTTDARTKECRTPGGPNAQKDGESFPELTIDKGNAADHGPEQTRQQTPVATITTQNQLQSVNQTEFTIKAQST